MPRKTHIEVMRTIHEILSEITAKSLSLKDKGNMFERLMQRWLNTDPRYAGKFTDVWLWYECSLFQIKGYTICTINTLPYEHNRNI